MRVSPDGRSAYVTSEAGNAVVALDARTGRVRGRTTVDARPRDLVVTADGRQLYVSAEVGGTVVLVGLPPGEFPTPIFDVVLKRLTVRGSIVGTRLDLAESLAFAAEGTVRSTYTRQPLETVNDVLAGLRAGTVTGRVVLDVPNPAPTRAPDDERHAALDAVAVA